MEKSLSSSFSWWKLCDKFFLSYIPKRRVSYKLILCTEVTQAQKIIPKFQTQEKKFNLETFAYKKYMEIITFLLFHCSMTNFLTVISSGAKLLIILIFQNEIDFVILSHPMETKISITAIDNFNAIFF